MVLLLSGAVLELSVAHNDAAGKQARTIRNGNKGRNAILWESCYQRVQRQVGSHDSLVFPHLLFLGRDKTHVEWVRAFTAIFDDMKQYVMEYHATGLVWNAKARKTHASPSRAWVDKLLYYRVYPSPNTRPQHHPPLPPVVFRIPHLRLHLLGRRRQLPPQPLLVVLRQCSPSLIVVQK